MKQDPAEIEQLLTELDGRIAKAIAWFEQADPDGGLYFQWKSGLREHSRMPRLEGTPAHDEWKRYCRNMAAYQELMGRLERLERKRAAA